MVEKAGVRGQGSGVSKVEDRTSLDFAGLTPSPAPRVPASPLTPGAKRPRVGVLALQGDVPEHLRAAEQAGAEAVPVRRRAELDTVDALILPGGESTTVGKLLERYDLMEPIRERIRGGMPVLGTCTGLILLAKEIEGSDQPRLGLLDVTVRRNAYGRQVDSFEADVAAPALGAEPLRAVFIRAPMVTRTGREVEVLAEAGGHPILVRQGGILGAAFHPEMAGEERVHRFLIELIEGRERNSQGCTG